ncbi:MAG: NUDIX domain-containing protein, partial [Burkholderiales bacterium]|nr:NUDIX domain-containing protein [Burkholderiales bacterium]
MAESKTLVLVDGSSYLYRAYHALPDLRNAAGEPTAWPRRGRVVQRRTIAWCLPLYVRHDGAWWLQRRPARGIWAGLWAPPVLEDETPLRAWSADAPGRSAQWMAAFTHALTHRDLRLQPVL